MFGRIFSAFHDSYTESLKLQERYRKITIRLGCITVAISFVGLIPLMYQSWLLFGLPLEGGPIEGLRLKLIAWIILTILMLPFAFYLGMLLTW